MTPSLSTPSVLIITGMHRSGTSLTASLLQSAGVNLGDRLMSEDRGNSKGHFEDLDFVEFHQRVLQAQELNIAGWTRENRLEVPASFRELAENLLATRQDLGIWGWKDPRTTLFLDFWSELIPHGKYIFVYRSPWDVVDSLLRRRDVIFQQDPNFALAQWCNYNQAILDFRQRYPDQCLLLNVAQVICNPEIMVNLVNQRWNWALRSPEILYEPEIFKANRDYYLQTIITKFFPEAATLYGQLQQQADGTNYPTAPLPADLNYKPLVLQDWINLKEATTKIQTSDLETARLRKDLLIAQKKIEKLENLIQAMESSKFWQMRQKWLNLKQKLDLNDSDRLYQDHVQKTNPATTDYSTEVYSGNQVNYLKWLKQNIPQKAALKKIIWGMKSLLPTPPSISLTEPAQSNDPIYQKWLTQNYPHPQKLSSLSNACQKLAYQPLISIIVPVYNPDAAFLRQAIASVLGQVYPHWELCLADDCSSKPYVKQILEEYQQQDSRIKVVFRQSNGHISHASNSALAVATGEYIALLDHDDLLAPHALSSVVELLNQHPEADFIYTDEDKVNGQNIHSDPYFKPDWCPDSFLSRMYTCHLGVYRRTLVHQVGNFRPGFEGSQDYDLVLRVTEQTAQIFHIPDVLYHWRIHHQSTAAFADAKTYAFDAGQKAIQEAIARRGEPGKVFSKPQFPGVYTIRYELKAPKLVSVIIPTKDLADTLNVCLESIFEKTSYPHYEIIVIDNGSTEASTVECLESWSQREPERFRSYPYDIPFNYSQINNYGVSQAQGDYLLFLNNDTEIISADWMEAMVEQAQRESIGAVGGLLLYPDDTVQHAGVVLGLHDVAGHGHQNFAVGEAGYISQLVSTNNYSAVTAACLMCRREVFELVGGFETELAIAFNDIDFCLKLISQGYRNVYLPHVVLYHYESKSRGYENSPAKQARFAQEVAYMKQQWSEICDRDPCYNPNLSKNHDDYRVNI
jgi:O-antigen biosynthesis protein